MLLTGLGIDDLIRLDVLLPGVVIVVAVAGLSERFRLCPLAETGISLIPADLRRGMIGYWYCSVMV
jgi:hypothetical protein